MTLVDVAQLGSYQILSPLGAGGMGEVYRAKDAKLDREVAIKVLPEALARDKERVARFDREAKVLAALNHANIAGIYGLEEVDGKAFLVMELAEGQTLAERIKNGPLPIDDALAVGTQIAAALEAAHDKGIIHRDLKPENVKITPDGEIKVLDFGLAKAMAPPDERSGSRLSDSPTLTVGHSPTAPGVVLGTAAYMSPEQARGKALDKRTDIWSFGVVLHETLTGRRVFAGETISDSIGAILHKEPDWAALPSETPPTVQLLLRRCLAKEPSKRLRDIGDARIELENAMADPTSSSLGLAHSAVAEAIGGNRRTHRAFSAITLAVLVVVAAISAVTGWSLKPEPEARVRKFSIVAEDYEPSQGVAISPDGRKVVYVAGNRLWVREIDRLEPRELPGTDNATQPIWSPDGSHIAYATENKLWQIPSWGGTPTAIGTLPTAMLSVGGLSWLEDGRIMIATGNTGLHEVSARGGEIRTILDVDPATEEDFHHAAALSGGRGVLFTIHRKGGGPDKIDLWTPTGRKTLLEIEGERFDHPVYSRTGHILYSRATTTPGLWAMPFSLSTLEVAGEPFLVASDARRPSVSDDGTLVYFRGTASVLRRLVWIDRKGEVTGTVGQPQPGLGRPRLSPDGARVVVEAQEPDARNIWIHDIVRGTKTRLTFGRSAPSHPVWIPGTDAVAYGTGAGGRGSAWMKRADGGGEATDLGIRNPTSCSSDGKCLLYQQEGDNGTDDIWYLPLDGEGKAVPLIQGGTEDRNAMISPDGSLVAYEYRDAGLEEIFLTTFPSGEGRWQVSVNSGANPCWSPNGNELFYMEVGTYSLMSVSVQREPTVSLGTPQKLFSGHSSGVSLFAGYDVGPDAERFLMVQVSDPESDKRGLAVVENWFAEFEDRR